MSDTGLRERKKSETRRVIASVALELALQHGPDEITVDDIAAMANVSPRTVFNYFGSKDEAILGIDPDKRAEISAQLLARPAAETPLEAIAAVLTELLTSGGDSGQKWRDRSRLVAQYPHLLAAQTASQSAMEAELAATVAARTGLPDDHPYCHLVVAASLLVSRSALAQSSSFSNATTRRLLDEGFATLARGFTPPHAGRRR